jgi:microsomal dipeptidase-like Zn-dependent dipeptidase
VRRAKAQRDRAAAMSSFEDDLRRVEEHVAEARRFVQRQKGLGSLQDYAQWVQLVAAMLRGGFTPEEVSMIAGGNYMRIFRVAVG